MARKISILEFCERFRGITTASFVKFKIWLQICRLWNFKILKFCGVEVRSKILKQGLRTKIFVQIKFHATKLTRKILLGGICLQKSTP